MTLLAVDGVRLSRSERAILRGVTLRAERGEVVALMGLSGGGKTTVLRAIVGLEAFDSGMISVDGVLLRGGETPSPAALRELRRRAGLVFQFHHLFEHLTAIENVTLAPVHAAGVPRAEATRRAEELLAMLGVSHRKDAWPRDLSGGEAQRVAIARAMAMDPPLLLMDEPTASLDPARRFEIGKTLRELAAGGRAIVITTHDDDFARESADRAVIMAEGEVVEDGAAREVLDRPQHPATRAFLRAVHT